VAYCLTSFFIVVPVEDCIVRLFCPRTHRLVPRKFSFRWEAFYIFLLFSHLYCFCIVFVIELDQFYEKLEAYLHNRLNAAIRFAWKNSETDAGNSLSPENEGNSNSQSVSNIDGKTDSNPESTSNTPTTATTTNTSSSNNPNTTATTNSTAVDQSPFGTFTRRNSFNAPFLYLSHALVYLKEVFSIP
jgi:cytoskeletal protein RodZ